MAADPNDALPAGTLLGRYRVERLLGAGAMGAVYLAKHTGLGKTVVVKVLHPQYAQSTTIRKRFVQEGEAAARIRHAHVVDVTDVGVEGAIPYLVMEHLEGESLGDLIERVGALSPDRAVDLLLPVIAAVDAAHAAGVVHRDLKPDNLFVARTATGDPLPKVLDFGISRVVSDGDPAFRTGTAAMLGTPAYMAPEQIESARDADGFSDQYALGVILCECLTGRSPFKGDNVYAVLKRVGEGRFEAPRVSRPDLDARLEAVVLRAMAHDRRARFPSLKALGTALLPFASDRVRMIWGTTFQPPAEHGHADTRLDLSSAGPSLGHGDTMHAAAVAIESTTVPMGVARRRTRWAAVAGVGLLAVAGLAVVALKGPSPEPPAAAAPVATQRAPVTAIAPLAAPAPAPAVALPTAPPVRVPASTPPVPVPARGAAQAAGVVPSRRNPRGVRHREAGRPPRRDPLAGIDAAP